jgi:lysozyme
MKLIAAMLVYDEGLRLQVYDDATGKALVRGDTLQGNPTIGTGRCLSTNGISQAESAMLLENDIERVTTDVAAAIPCFPALNEPRQAVLLSMAFQMGVQGLLQFRATLNSVAAGDFSLASEYMLDSPWARQTPARAQRLADMMRLGDASPYVS